MLAILVLVFVAVVTLAIILRGRQRYPGAPPGPIPFPFVGNLPQLLHAHLHTHLAMYKLSKTYGNVMYVKLGTCDMVVLSSYEAAKAICAMPPVINRQYNPTMEARSFGKPLGLILNSGELYKHTKRFTVKNLREYGFGKSKTMETSIHEQANEFIALLLSELPNNEDSCVLDMSAARFQIPVINVLWGMVAGETFPQDSGKHLKLMELQDQTLRSVNLAGGIALAYPSFSRRFPKLTGLTRLSEINRPVQEFLRTLMREHSHNTGDPTNFVEKMMQEVERNEEFTEEHGIVLLMDLFVAGSETSASTISFCLLYAVKYPEVLEKVQAEIDRVLEPGQQPQLDDVGRLPYTRSVILEAMRHVAIVAITPARIATEDVTWNGMLIKADVPIVVNLYAVLNEEKFWGDPERFRPERFLSVDGTLDTKLADRVTSFGFANRLCIGQPLADSISFLFFTRICQVFKLSVPAGQPAPSTTPRVGIAQTPQPYRLLLQRR